MKLEFFIFVCAPATFHATGLFLYPLKTLKKMFLFSGGAKRDQWHERVKVKTSKAIQNREKLNENTLEKLMVVLECFSNFS